MNGTEAPTDELTYSSIDKIIAMPAVLYVPVLRCGHICHCSDNRAEVGEVGDRRRCLSCARERRGEKP